MLEQKYIYKNSRIAMRYWKLDAREGGKIISKKNRLNSAAADVDGVDERPADGHVLPVLRPAPKDAPSVDSGRFRQPCNIRNAQLTGQDGAPSKGNCKF